MSSVITDEIVKEAQKLAEDNYSEWGQYIVECYGFEELRQELLEYADEDDIIGAWVEIRKSVAGVHKENEQISKMLWSW